MIEAVVFDYFGTLTTSNGAPVWWSQLPELVAEAGGVLTDELLTWFSTLPEEHPDHSRDEVSYRAWCDGRLDHLLRATGLATTSRERLLMEVLEERYSRTFSAFPEVLDVLTELKRRGFRVGVCSNWDWGLDRELSAVGLEPLVDFAVCSARVGFRKPHRRIFGHVIEAARVSPDQVLFVGDEWAADVAGSRRAGFNAVHLARGSGCPISEHEDVPCAPDLNGVVSLVYSG